MKRTGTTRPQSEWPRSCAYVSPLWPPDGPLPNGIVFYVARLAAAVRSLGVNALVLPLKGTDAPAEGVVLASPVDTSRSPLARLRRAVAYRLGGRHVLDRAIADAVCAVLWRLADQDHLDIAEIPDSFGWAQLIASRSPVPVVVRLHGPWFQVGPSRVAREDGTFRRRVKDEGAGIVAAHGVTAPSKDILDRTRNYYGLELGNACICPNPVEAAGPEGQWRLERCDRNRILFVGRFDSCKGGDVALDSFSQLVDRRPDAVLTFVGPDFGFADAAGKRWTIATYLAERVSERARARVTFLGLQNPDAIGRLRCRALVTVVPSRYETFCNTAVEAMAAGSPLIASAAGGLPEIVQDGRNGLLVRPGDAGDLARALEQLLGQPERAAELGHQAFSDCVERFDPVKTARQTLEYYAEVMSREARRLSRIQHPNQPR